MPRSIVPLRRGMFTACLQTLFRRCLAWATLLVLLVSGLSQAQDGQPNGSALIVPIGGTVRLQMQSKKPIKNVENSKDSVVNIRTVVGDPTTVLLTGQQPDATIIELTDAADHKEKYEVIVQLDVEYLKTQIRRAVPTANVVPIPSSNNAIILTGTVACTEDLGIILRVAQSLGGIQVIDALRVGGVQQVQLDVVVASVSQPPNPSGGSNSSSFKAILEAIQSTGEGRTKPDAGRQPVSSEASERNDLRQLYPIPDNGLQPIFSGASAFQFGVLYDGQRLIDHLEALETKGTARLLARPSLVTLSGRPATFLSGSEQAVPVVGGSSGATGVASEPIGTQLTFLPIVLGNGKIHMEVSPSITTLDSSGGRSRSSVNTTVQLESGQTFVIGGMSQQTTTASASRLPLYKLPLVGRLFSSGATTSREELIILMTPHLVGGQETGQAAQALPGQKQPELDPSSPSPSTFQPVRHDSPPTPPPPPPDPPREP